jgi:hypothetical protein
MGIVEARRSVKNRKIPFLLLCVSLLPHGCRQMEANYSFEEKPRAVLEQIGVTASRDPDIQISPSGTLAMLAVYRDGRKSRLGLFLSHDGGDTFGHRLPVSIEGEEVISHGENSPTLVYTPTATYALWEQANPQGYTDLMFARSIDFGKSFETPIFVTQKNEPSFNGFSDLALSHDGTLYAIWLDGREKNSKTGTFSVYMSRSGDGGSSFGSNILIAKGACPCCRPSIAFGANNELYVAWRHVFDQDIRDIVVSKSSDGRTFGPPVRVAVDNWRLNGCPDSGPVLQYQKDRLFVAWYTEASQNSMGIKLCWSENNGSSFQPPVLVTEKQVDVNHPRFSLSSDGALLLTFQGRDRSQNAGWNPLNAYLVEVDDFGEISGPIQLPGNGKSISYPSVLAGTAGRAYVAWTEPGEQDRRIMLVRARKE